MKDKVRVVACGILQKEVNFLINKNHWDVVCSYLSSSLHVDFDKLYKGLEHNLDNSKDRPSLVLYGVCHPGIDRLIKEKGGYRKPVQNCLEMLLGRDIFNEKLKEGAFFLLEDWAHSWDKVSGEAISRDKEALKWVFQQEHKYLLGINTPCSGDFSEQARVISLQTGLPLKWLNIDLEVFEEFLSSALEGV